MGYAYSQVLKKLEMNMTITKQIKTDNLIFSEKNKLPNIKIYSYEMTSFKNIVLIIFKLFILK